MSGPVFEVDSQVAAVVDLQGSYQAPTTVVETV
jgi:hypothetical protein